MVNGRIQIVMADDEVDDHFFLKEAIDLTGIRSDFVSFYNGATLLDFLHSDETVSQKRSIPDIIILDINMPNLNGIEVLTLIKADPALQSIPVYILSTATDVNTNGKCMQLGAKNYYKKPNDVKELKAIVEDIFATIPNYN